jgi:hypothetical protein
MSTTASQFRRKLGYIYVYASMVMNKSKYKICKVMKQIEGERWRKYKEGAVCDFLVLSEL